MVGSVGVFDSGVGGLSVLQAMRRELPHEHFLYVADSGCAPYGDRSAAFVVERAITITDFLVQEGAKAVVVACNTASTVALQHEFGRQHSVGVQNLDSQTVRLSPYFDEPRSVPASLL